MSKVAAIYNYDYKTKSRRMVAEAVIFIVYVVLAFFPAVREVGFDRDSVNYAHYIKAIVESDFAYINKGLEPAFYLITFISSKLFSDVVRGVFVIYAFLALGIKTIAIKKYSDNIFISLIVYLAFLYIVQDFNTIRASVATGIFLFAYGDIKEHRFFRYLVKIAIAVTFHYSALIFIFFYFVNNKTFRRILYPLIILGLIFAVSGLSESLMETAGDILPGAVGSKIRTYIYNKNVLHIEYTSSFRTFYNYGMIVLMAFIDAYMKDIDEEIQIQTGILKLSVAFFFITVSLPVVGSRISEASEVYLALLVPHILYKMNKDEQKVFGTIIVLFCSVLFVLQSLVKLY